MSPMALIVEQLGDAAAFSDGMADYAYSTRTAVAGRTEPHPELHDRLILAVGGMQGAGQAQVIFKLKSGEVQWLPKGGIHSVSNTADTACSFITFEFP